MDDTTYAELRIEPGPPLPALVQSVTEAIAQARARGTRRLLIDLRALAGATPPSLAQRDALVTAWARAAGGDVVIAAVAPAELLDPERFGVFVAAAAGLRAEGSEEAEAARAWLARQPDPRVVAPVRAARSGSAAS